MKQIRLALSRVIILTWVAVLMIGLLPLGLVPPKAAAAPAAQLAGDEVIVVLQDGANPTAAARDLGLEPTYIYRHVFSGFAARMPASAATAARRSSLVAIISPDVPVEAQGQRVPTGVRRIDANQPGIWPTPKQVNADVAVLDTGIQRKQKRVKQKNNKHTRDLNVRNGKTCIGQGKSTVDKNGHGTHVAGTIGAKNNNYGVIGVAPKVRLHAVKVLKDDGFGSTGSVICGLDWVMKNRTTIDVVNLSLGGPGGPGGDCANGKEGTNAFHWAFCRVVNVAGIPVVVASGNQGANADNFIPARFPEVITVSAFADTDGLPGDLGSNCFGEQDDHYAYGLSNFGPAVDITAPGICIRSTSRRGGTVVYSGTSMATPHVAGALALYFHYNPGASADDARTWLLNDASVPQIDENGIPNGTGTNGSDEPVLFLENAFP